MSDLPELLELITYIARTSRLSEAEAARVVNEVLSYLAETPESFVRRRHHALQAEGLPNSVIFARLASEVQQLRFRAGALSERQIRRIIYG